MTVWTEDATGQFEHVNALRDYPFAVGSSRRGRQGRELPQDVLVDAHLVVPVARSNPDDWTPDDGPTVRLVSVHLAPQLISACFVAEQNGVRSALSVTVARATFRPYVPYRLEPLAGSLDCGGVVTFGDFTFPGFPETYFFSNAVLHPGCCARAQPPALRKFVDPRSGETVAGSAEIDFSGYIQVQREGRAFRLALEKGADAELASDCARATGRDVCGATPIRTINGVRPDADGNIVLWFH